MGSVAKVNRKPKAGSSTSTSLLDNTQQVSYSMAMSTFDRVKEFHKAMGVPESDPTVRGALEFRLRLLWEEYKEVLDAAGYYPDVEVGFRPNGKVLDKANLLKELADLDYVVAGAAITFGWDFNEAGKRVHESNMSKLGDDGKPVRREDGKVLKGPNYKAPDLGDLVNGPRTRYDESVEGCGCRACGCERAARD